MYHMYNTKSKCDRINRATATRLVARKRWEEQGCNRSYALDVRSADVEDAAAAAVAGAELVDDRCGFPFGPDRPAYSYNQQAWEGCASGWGFLGT
jgi:hypothetical protein